VCSSCQPGQLSHWTTGSPRARLLCLGGTKMCPHPFVSQHRKLLRSNVRIHYDRGLRIQSVTGGKGNSFNHSSSQAGSTSCSDYEHLFFGRGFSVLQRKKKHDQGLRSLQEGIMESVANQRSARATPIAQAVSRWLPTAEARVRARVRSSGICGGQSGDGTSFPGVLRSMLPICTPPNSIRTSSQSPGAGTIGQKGRRAVWTHFGLHPPPPPLCDFNFLKTLCSYEGRKYGREIRRSVGRKT
jgi:hypothetical protein